MPNHFHAVVEIAANNNQEAAAELGSIVGAFKSMTTHAYIKGVTDFGWPGFEKRLWQRNYWEYIIRDEDDLNRVRVYIERNPICWVSDQLYLTMKE